MHTQVNKFESDKALKFSIGIFQTHVFRIFFPGIIFEISSSTWKIQSILSSFLLILEKKRKEKHWHANCLKGNFIERLKLLFVWDLCLYRLSLGTHLQFFWRELTIEYHLYYWKIEKCSFIRGVWVFNIYINKIYWIFLWIILKCTETFYWLLN